MIIKKIIGILIMVTITFSSCKDGIIEKNPENSNLGLKVVFFNTGKSDGILIKIENMTLFIDTGDADDSENYSSVMNELGIENIDYIILSHLDSDHIGGAPYLLENYNVGHIIQPDYVKNESTEYDNYISTLESLNIKVDKITEELDINNEGGKIRVIPCQQKEYDSSNSYSMVVSVIYGNEKFLFCGDSDSERIEELLDEDFKDYTVYKVPHHGFYNDKQEALIKLVNPQYAVITNKSLSNISSSVIDNLNTQGTEIYYTFMGNIYFETDGEEMKIYYK